MQYWSWHSPPRLQKNAKIAKDIEDAKDIENAEIAVNAEDIKDAEIVSISQILDMCAQVKGNEHPHCVKRAACLPGKVLLLMLTLPKFSTLFPHGRIQ